MFILTVTGLCNVVQFTLVFVAFLCRVRPHSAPANGLDSFLPLPAGGALSRGGGGSKSDMIKVPPPSMGVEMGQLLASGNGTDYTFVVEGEEMKVTRIAVTSSHPIIC